MYCIGDFVVYGSSGICQIKDITDLQSQGMAKDKLYYLMIPVGEKDSKIYASVNGANIGMRRVMTKEEAYKLIDEVPEIEELKVDNEKNRERCYQQAIRGCDGRELVSVIKTLYMRKRRRLAEGKKSTSTDDKYFKIAESSLYSELAFVLGEEQGSIPKLIENRVKQTVK